MKTELIVSDPQPVAGEQIKVHRYSVRNFRLHKMLQTIARTLLFLLEADSNNSSATHSARDSRNLQVSLANVRAEWERAKKFRDSPSGSLEKEYEIYIADPAEIQRMNNMKSQCVAQELYNLSTIISFNDSSKMQHWVGESASRDIEEALSVAEEVILETVGDGSEGADTITGFNTGQEAPDFSILGTLDPDVDGDRAGLAEPSTGEVNPPVVPDVPDRPSTLKS